MGPLPGISEEGIASPTMQRLIDGLKASSSLNKVFYWNWNLAPEGPQQRLTTDFVFMPSVWGATALPMHSSRLGLRKADESPFLDMDGGQSPAQMATLLLGTNEPDITGACMKGVFGKCTSPCSEESIRAGDCPVAAVGANEWGECKCSEASGAGFWPLEGCAGLQPLPTLWEAPHLSDRCIGVAMDEWKQTVLAAKEQGFKYLSTPQVAVHVSYARKFIERACGCNEEGQCSCTDASCGCPVYVAFHFYGSDCRPETNGDYLEFEKRLREVAEIMEAFHFVEGAIVNEVGMLDRGSHPASWHHEHGCPKTPELPNGLASFLEHLLELAMRAKTKDGRFVVKGFAWFNLDRTGGTYNLKLQKGDGSLSELGKAYVAGCQRWGERSS